MKNSCPSRALSARSKSVLEIPALTPNTHEQWLDLRFEWASLVPRYPDMQESVTTFWRYEPEVWRVAADRVRMFASVGYASEVVFPLLGGDLIRMSGHCAFFRLEYGVQSPNRSVRWNEIHFAVMAPYKVARKYRNRYAPKGLDAMQAALYLAASKSV